MLLWVLIAATPGYASQSALDRDGVLSVQLSPDGEHIAILTRQDDVDKLYVVSVAQKKAISSQRRDSPDRIYSVAWIDSNHIVIQSGRSIPYEILPEITGVLGILTLGAGFEVFTIDRNDDSGIRQAIAEHSLTVVDSLPQLPSKMLVSSQSLQGLWLIDVRSGAADSIEYPPLDSAVFIVSPDSSYLMVSGTDELKSNHVMSLFNKSASSWVDLDSKIKPVAISDSGTAYAYLPDKTGVYGLIAIGLNTGTTKLLFQDQEHDVAQSFFDPLNEPYAVSYLPGHPNWHFVDENHVLAESHKTLRAAMPDAYVAIISSSSDFDKSIAKTTHYDRPNRYYLFDRISGQIQHLIDSQSSLYTMGGSDISSYSSRPFSFTTASGLMVYGFISYKSDSSKFEPQPTVAWLRNDSHESRWEWGYDQEVAFLIQQGFNVLMVNHTASPGYRPAYESVRSETAALDVENAIQWAIRNKYATDDKICVIGRGSGAEIALRVALRNRSYKCAISIGGDFTSPDTLAKPGVSSKEKKPGLNVLLIYGQDDDQEYLDTQSALRSALDTLRIDNESMLIAGDNRALTEQKNEIGALARIVFFLNEHIGPRSPQPSLPMTANQAKIVDDVLGEYRTRLNFNKVGAAARAKRWLIRQNEKMQKIFSNQQWLAYEAIVNSAAGGSNLDESLARGIRGQPPSRSAERPPQ